VKLSATAGGQCCARRRLALVELAEPACLDTANPHLSDPWNCERRFVEFVREAGRWLRRALAEPLAEPAGRQRRGIAPQRRLGIGAHAGSSEWGGVGSGRERTGADGSGRERTGADGVMN
jgi:hypothetical protein